MQPGPPDAEIVRAAKAGDLASLEELTSRHERRIHSIAYRILQNPHDTEDVTQQAFLSAVENLAKFREESSFATWLYRIATFAALCPRSPTERRRRMKGQKFARLQRRRAQTEARISILKQGFLGRPMRAKGFAHRELALAWGVLTHNLWMLARMAKTQPRTKHKTVPLRQAA